MTSTRPWPCITMADRAWKYSCLFVILHAWCYLLGQYMIMWMALSVFWLRPRVSVRNYCLVSVRNYCFHVTRGVWFNFQTVCWWENAKILIIILCIWFDLENVKILIIILCIRSDVCLTSYESHSYMRLTYNERNTCNIHLT